MKPVYLNKNIDSKDKLPGSCIKPKDLPTDEIDIKYKEKILDLKKICKKEIKRDFKKAYAFTFLPLFIIAGLLCEGVFNNDTSINPILGLGIIILCLIVILFAGKSLILIPKRFSNLKHYNFERACYAKVVDKFEAVTGNERGRAVSAGFVNLQINKDKHIKGVVMLNENDFIDLKKGEKVIVFSFEGVFAYAVATLDWEERHNIIM